MDCRRIAYTVGHRQSSYYEKYFSENEKKLRSYFSLQMIMV
jgi:hypothetical protein